MYEMGWKPQVFQFMLLRSLQWYSVSNSILLAYSKLIFSFHREDTSKSIQPNIYNFKNTFNNTTKLIQNFAKCMYTDITSYSYPHIYIVSIHTYTLIQVILIVIEGNVPEIATSPWFYLVLYNVIIIQIMWRRCYRR